MQKLWVVNTIDLSKVGRSGEKVAPTIGEMDRCDCCGRMIKKINILNNGAKVGSECRLSIEDMSRMYTFEAQHDTNKFDEVCTPNRMYVNRITKKQLAFFKAQ